MIWFHHPIEKDCKIANLLDCQFFQNKNKRHKKKGKWMKICVSIMDSMITSCFFSIFLGFRLCQGTSAAPAPGRPPLWWQRSPTRPPSARRTTQWAWAPTAGLRCRHRSASSPKQFLAADVNSMVAEDPKFKMVYVKIKLICLKSKYLPQIQLYYKLFT